MPPKRSSICIGSSVLLVQKLDQPTGRLTKGIVKRLLTSGEVHPHGIKVELVSGEVGRVQKIVRATECIGEPDSRKIVASEPSNTSSCGYSLQERPINTALTSSEGPACSNSSFADQLAGLENMGFKHKHAVEALNRCQNNMDDAVMFIVEHGDEGMEYFAQEREFSAYNKYNNDFPSL